MRLIELAVRVALELLGLAVQVALVMLQIAARLCGYLFQQMVVPGVRALAGAVSQLALRAADRRNHGTPRDRW